MSQDNQIKWFRCFMLQYLKMSEIDDYSLKYFEELQEKIKNCVSELESLGVIAEERERKYSAGLKAYQKYIQHQNQMLGRNKLHCELRNQNYLDEVKKAWKVGVSNRSVILKSITRTNIVKRDTDEWINGIDSSVFQKPQSRQNTIKFDQGDLSGSKLIDRYKEILHEYNLK